MYKFTVIRDQCLTCTQFLTILSSSLLLFFSRSNIAKRCMPFEWQQTARENGRVDQAELRITSLARPRYVQGSSAGRPSIQESIPTFSHNLYSWIMYPRRLDAEIRVCLMSSVQVYLGKKLFIWTMAFEDDIMQSVVQSHDQSNEKRIVLLGASLDVARSHSEIALRLSYIDRACWQSPWNCSG